MGGAPVARLAYKWVNERRARREISDGTWRAHMKIMRDFGRHCGAIPVERLSQRHVEKWLEQMTDLAPNTRRLRFGTVRTFCRWLAAERYVRRDPTVRMKAPRPARSVPRALPASDVAATLAACLDSRESAIVWLMVGLGLRRAEVAGLQLGDWDRGVDVLYVCGKGGHTRMLPMVVEVRSALERYLAEHPTAAGPLIRSKRDGCTQLQPEHVGRLVRDLMTRAGVKTAPWDGRGPHSYRHTAASDVVDRQPDLRVVQMMLGHQHLSSTQIYLRRAALPQLREAMEGRSYTHAS